MPPLPIGSGDATSNRFNFSEGVGWTALDAFGRVMVAPSGIEPELFALRGQRDADRRGLPQLAVVSENPRQSRLLFTF